MPKETHTRAAEHHENAAKAHRTAAEHHGKGDHDKGHEELTKAHEHSALAHSLVWDEAQKLAGKDADFNRRDLFEAIERGDYPEWELGLQIVEEEDEFKFDFDLLDPRYHVTGVKRHLLGLGEIVIRVSVQGHLSELE